ncbi:hypothetical protein RSOLAG22IIIB_05880 [Rhizoctonia solani]|uniref:Uncharacterized protein n=1 Tax=Rhizoctonia solani TaxID=456999 RepID=A0A0K6G9W4_9AGAM|nr:hypothetical protein RSOLAG22IIIB_05880 [Rhizoctonia solani]
MARIATGFVCSRDSAGEPLCSDPNAHTATSIPAPQPTTTHVEITQTVIAPTTDPLEPSQTGGLGTIFPQSTSKKNVGAIAGGTVTGVVVLVAMLVFLILWRRKQPNGTTDSEVPAGGPAVTGPSEKDAYSPSTVPPTPGTVNPFLTPMNQHPNPGISYFPGPVDKPPVERPTSIGSSTHYTGLPEPQHGDDMGVAVGATPTPVPRHDLHHPYPLPMTVTSLRDPSIDSGPTRVWSGFIPSPSPPAGQNAARGGGTTPIPSGWSCHEGTNTNSMYSNPPGASTAYGSTPPPRAPSTIYQAPEGERYTGNHEPYSPPASPPPESLYPRAFATLGGLPGGAAPPVTNFAPVEKTLE